MINYHIHKDSFWCRYGKAQKGFSIRWAGKPLFSERNGYVKVYKWWIFTIRKLD